MNKLLLASICLFGSLALSACSSSSDSSNIGDNNNKSDVSTNTTLVDETQPATNTTINGLGKTQNQRYKIIVLPTKVDTAQLQGPPLSSEILSESIAHEISAALNQTHKFDIIVPEINQPLVSKSEQDEDNKKSVNLVLTSALSQLEANETIKIIKATGQGVEAKAVFIVLNYQIIDAETLQALLSKTVRYKLNSFNDNDSIRKAIDTAIKETATMVKNQIISEIYPARVVAILDNRQVVLDQPLTVGSQCELYELGGKISDSYSNTTLGYEEKFAGLLTIERTTNILSFARLDSGYADKEFVCKPIITVEIKGAPNLVTETSQGGVKLPFD